MTFEEIAVKAGWDEQTMLSVALGYIDYKQLQGELARWAEETWIDELAAEEEIRIEEELGRWAQSGR